MLNLEKEIGNNINEIISQMRKESRDWPVESMNDFISNIRRSMKVWSWGPQAWSNYGKILRFKVNAYRHKGHIYVRVNGADLFDIILTTTRGKIQKVFKDVFVGDFIEVVDQEIEKIPEYNR